MVDITNVKLVKKKPNINKISDDNCIKLNKPFDWFSE